MSGKKKEIKRLKKEVLSIQKRYERANEEKLTLANVLSIINEELKESLHNEKRFIASVSHELRTPMTSIIGYGELLNDTNLNSKQKRYMQSITQSSRYLLSLVNDLLDVAKFKDKRVELSPKVVELNDILTECATLMESKIADGVKFEANLPILDYKIKADDKRLKQIVLNLLSNAAKFTKEGTIKFYVDPIVECENNQFQITLHVEDTGVGIPDEIRDTLFDPFCSTDKTQGTGLGLFISQELAELMHGNITVSSVEGIGSHFTLKFFVEKSVKKELGKALIGINILMCSASNSFIDSVSMELSRMSMQSFEHYNVETEGIEYLVAEILPRAKAYDIIIFDVDIMKEDALHLAKMFTVLNPNIKIVSYLDDDNQICSDIFSLSIHKPIGHQRFIHKLEKSYANRVSKSTKRESYSNLKILLVEDVELNRIYEVEMLKNFFGITCDTAEDGSVALQKAKENSYDVILMDMRMPIMDGLEATRKIREFDKKIPIICMSANVYKEDKIAAEESGMNDFIEKPLEYSDIENKLVRLINHEFSSEEISKNYKKIAYDFLRENFDEEMVKQLCQTAKDSIKETIVNIKLHTQSNKIRELTDDFHRLKGVFLNLGLKELAEEAESLQRHAREREFSKIVEVNPPFIESIEMFLSED
jgi:CheY-like chemotaxis protein/anti-sigma regulatory factor (Ser/Thr protein kinase)